MEKLGKFVDNFCYLVFSLNEGDEKENFVDINASPS